MSSAASISVPTLPVSGPLPSPSSGRAGSALAGGFNELRVSSGSRKARVLYDYDAAGSSELSLLADEVSPEKYWGDGATWGLVGTPCGLTSGDLVAENRSECLVTGFNKSTLVYGFIENVG